MNTALTLQGVVGHDAHAPHLGPRHKAESGVIAAGDLDIVFGAVVGVDDVEHGAEIFGFGADALVISVGTERKPFR